VASIRLPELRHKPQGHVNRSVTLFWPCHRLCSGCRAGGGSIRPRICASRGTGNGIAARPRPRSGSRGRWRSHAGTGHVCEQRRVASRRCTTSGRLPRPSAGARITVRTRGSWGAGNYSLCNKSFDPRFIIARPTARCDVSALRQGSRLNRRSWKLQRSAAGDRATQGSSDRGVGSRSFGQELEESGQLLSTGVVVKAGGIRLYFRMTGIFG
jgi:hypothetical protein